MQPPIAILLCAGYGTRMGELTAALPKPLLPLAGRTLIDPLLDQLAGLPGLGTVHVVTNDHYAPAFATWAKGWQGRLGRRLVLHNDGTRTPQDRLGAVGDLAFVLTAAGQVSGALVAAGDNVLRFSLEPLWQSFLTRGRSQVLALHESDPEKLRRTGVLELAPDDRVLRLSEKPEVPASSWACPSVYCLDADALDRVGPYLAAGQPRDEIGRFIADLVRHTEVDACRLAGKRLHVGTPAAYARAQEILAREPVILPASGQTSGDG